MLENENEVTVLSAEMAEYDNDNILAVAERSEKLVAALDIIMNAAIRITTYLDWVLIGGKPYLQETGATKVARLFGIGWKILDGYPRREYDNGYPIWEYRMEFRMGKTRIEAEGSRSGKDEFFAGKDDSRKSPDEIDANDVKKSAYTNCLNSGIKRLLPGLRNIDVATLEKCGIDVGKIRGYTFKETAKGGKGKSAESSGLVCAECGKAITQSIASYSEGKFGRHLCMDCQKSYKPAEAEKQSDDKKPQQKPANSKLEEDLVCEACGIKITKAEAAYSLKKYNEQLCRNCQEGVGK